MRRGPAAARGGIATAGIASVVAAAAAFLALAVAAAPAAAQGGGDRVAVVASFSILRDFVARVGGDRVDVTALIGPGGNPHVYAPSPGDVRRAGAARLLVVNGLGFEGSIDRLIAAAGTRVVVASRGVTRRALPASAAHGLHDPDPHGLDPHAWLSVAGAAIYVANIRDGLVAADPAARTLYDTNATTYLAELARLDADIRSVLTAIPADRRKVITTHDAFGYFGAAYGIDFIAAQGVSSESEPSARDIAAIIRTIRRDRIPALFFESTVDPRLIHRIAAETGIGIGGTLYSDSLAAEGPAATYAGMMRHNAVTLADALRDGSSP